MPGATLPPDQGGSLNTFGQHLERLERRTIQGPSVPPTSMVFTYPGVLAANVTSPPWYPPRSGLIQVVRVSLLTSGSVTVEIGVNGSAATPQYTLTSATTAVFAAAIQVPIASFVTVRTVSAAGSNMTVQLDIS